KIPAWIEAMVAPRPGARPSAAWVADRAAHVLGLVEDEGEVAEARAAQVKRAYLAARAHEIGGRVGGVGEPARAWLEEACALVAKIGGAPGEGEIGPLGALGRARWIVALAGHQAAAWPADARGDDGELAARLTELARKVPPGAWTRDDVEGRAHG